MAQRKEFTVKVVRKKGINPLTKEHLNLEEEELVVQARSKLEAKELALSMTNIEFRGQEALVYIDGEIFIDPRF